VRNGDYWGEPAKVERIVYRFIPDATTRLQALQSGEIDAIAHVGSIMPSQGALVESDEDLTPDPKFNPSLETVYRIEE